MGSSYMGSPWVLKEETQRRQRLREKMIDNWGDQKLWLRERSLDRDAENLNHVGDDERELR